jgi:NitT/TauT family transport system substrate-binding protein
MKHLLAGVALGLAGITTALPAAAQTTTVRYVEVIRSVFYLPYYVADKNGYFKEQGIEVKLGTGWGSDKTTPQLIADTVDIALLGPEQQVYIENSPSTDKTKIVCKLTDKDGLLLLSRQKMAPRDFKWSMLKGKQFLDWRPGSTPYVDAAWVFKKHGINPSTDIKHLSNIGSGTREAAWLGGQGDFGTFFEPVASLFERDGKGYVVASLGDELGPVAYTVFMAKDKYIAKNAKVVQGWCNAIQKAQNFVAKAGPAELAKISAPFFPQLEHDLLINSIKRYQALRAWNPDTTVTPQDMVKVQDILILGGLMKAEQRVPYEKAVVRSFSENAKKLAR